MDASLALYRRYRPDTYLDVIGQEHVTEPLRQALRNNRVNHAYLFSGPRGCGKTTSARILARCLNCEQGPTPDPCGQCQSCTDLARGGPGSIDVIEIDAASHGGVDDARDLRERAFFAPVSARYKIYIVDEAHMVTTQGFNALLKLVEEPPDHLKFIFATTEPDKVIGTIRSRTHHYPFRLVPPKLLQDYLAKLCEHEGVRIESAALPLVVRAGAGSVRDTLSVLDQLLGGAGEDGVDYQHAVSLLGYTPDSLLNDAVQALATRDGSTMFCSVDKVIESGQDPKRFGEDLLRRLRDLVIVAAVPDAAERGLIDGPPELAEQLAEQASRFGTAGLTRAADVLHEGLTEMRGATAPRLQLELICARMLLPDSTDSELGVHARLERLEAAVRDGAVPPGPQAQEPAQAPASQPGTTARSSPAQPGSGQSRPVQPAAPQSAAAPSDGDAVQAPAAAGTPSASGPAPRAAEATAQPANGEPASGQSANGRSTNGESSTPTAVGAPEAQDDPWAAMPAVGSVEASAGDSAPSSSAATTNPAAQPGMATRSGPDHQAGSASASSAAPVGGAGLGFHEVRQRWEQILEAVSRRRRFTWIVLSQNGHLVGVDQQTVTVGFVNAGARDSFTRGGSDEIVQQALSDVLGGSWRVEAVVDPSGGGGSPRTGAPAAPSSGSGASPAGPAGDAEGGQADAAAGYGPPGSTASGAADPYSAGQPNGSSGNVAREGSRSTTAAGATASETTVSGAAARIESGHQGSGPETVAWPEPARVPDVDTSSASAPEDSTASQHVGAALSTAEAAESQPSAGQPAADRALAAHPTTDPQAGAAHTARSSARERAFSAARSPAAAGNESPGHSATQGTVNGAGHRSSSPDDEVDPETDAAAPGNPVNQVDLLVRELGAQIIEDLPNR